MNANLLIKSALYSIAALLTMGYALFAMEQQKALSVGLLLLSIGMLVIAWKHPQVLRQLPLRTSVLLLLHALVLAVIAWLLYRHGYHKATFVYEGVSIFYFSLAAFIFLLRKKQTVFFSAEE